MGATGREMRSIEAVTDHALYELQTMHLHVGLLLAFLLIYPGVCDLLRDSVHVTSAAARPNNDLWCYMCQAATADDKCVDLSHNNSALIQKCHNERRICMVKRFSYTTSTENSTTALKMWALERNCAKSCEPGCIVIGERTKLYACTACCVTSLCNYVSSSHTPTSSISLVICFLFYHINHYRCKFLST